MSQMMVNLIGAGRVGQTFLRLLSDVPDCTIQDILSHTYSSAENAVRFAGAGRAVHDYTQLRPADLWILAVPDTQIAVVAEQLAGALSKHESNQSIVIHCSGFFAAEQMSALRQLGWKLASVHPVLTFATPELAVRQFKGVFCGIEGDAAALETLNPLLEKIGAKPFPVESESKSLYHAAAVISNNFTVVLQAIAREAWAEAGVPGYVAEQLNNSMLRATYENVSSEGPQTALTGPAARGDEYVVTKQGEDVARWHPAAGKIYQEMSQLAHRLKSRGTTLDPEFTDT
ncbi:MAG: DUF2520 domain-containing protein [Roseibium sp.]|uniref:Rossmann-like and DUF2520 domain-containing protein n=1 Tax=Roseibium sp. TaxID=1936156 RepID=UPI00261B8B4E|nr:Rossmann-like and DUF2520 domain-containing protein [Roseibium sp.]MCV0425533.1 DUF2520 domain-containing protein [Roseibium sp.]